jgi:hypothetical protein
MRREGGAVREKTDIQRAAMLFGIIFLAVGVLGFIPGITTNYDGLTTFDDVGAKLLGIFGINILENVVHLLFGVAGLAAASSWAASKNYFIWGGVIYLVIWLYGLVIDLSSSANLIGVNTAANWLHFVLGVALIGVGFLLSRRVVADRAVTT